MLFSAARLFAATAIFGLSLVSAQNITESAFNCGTIHDPEAIAAAQTHILDVPKAWPRRLTARGPTTVPVNWNIIMDDGGQGSISDDRIQAQMVVLNSAFSVIGLTFQTKTLRHHTNSNWYNNVRMGNPQEIDMKKSLHQGGPNELNVYTVSLKKTSYFGYATFPWDYQPNPVADGVVMEETVITRGGITGFDTGKILTHEVGHWLGLLHTFQDGCNGGDYVDDTPAEASPASGCPIGRNTCTSPGNDPINNHMDYSNDDCRQLFTTGQYNRLAQMIHQFRGINLF